MLTARTAGGSSGTTQDATSPSGYCRARGRPSTSPSAPYSATKSRNSNTADENKASEFPDDGDINVLLTLDDDLNMDGMVNALPRTRRIQATRTIIIIIDNDLDEILT